jgi:hypothetical protein
MQDSTKTKWLRLAAMLVIGMGAVVIVIILMLFTTPGYSYTSTPAQTKVNHSSVGITGGTPADAPLEAVSPPQPRQHPTKENKTKFIIALCVLSLVALAVAGSVASEALRRRYNREAREEY